MPIPTSAHPANSGARQKLWLYHYQSAEGRRPEEDGFRGFVKKGQEFEFPDKIDSLEDEETAELGQRQ